MKAIIKPMDGGGIEISHPDYGKIGTVKGRDADNVYVEIDGEVKKYSVDEVRLLKGDL